MNDQDRSIRVWRVRTDSPGGILIGPDRAVVQANKNTFLSVTPGAIAVNAKSFSIQTSPENISKGILFRENMGFLQMIPSSLVTPIPNCMINFPGAGIVGALAPGLAACAGLIA